MKDFARTEKNQCVGTDLLRQQQLSHLSHHSTLSVSLIAVQLSAIVDLVTLNFTQNLPFLLLLLLLQRPMIDLWYKRRLEVQVHRCVWPVCRCTRWVAWCWQEQSSWRGSTADRRRWSPPCSVRRRHALPGHMGPTRPTEHRWRTPIGPTVNMKVTVSPSLNL